MYRIYTSPPFRNNHNTKSSILPMMSVVIFYGSLLSIGLFRKTKHPSSLFLNFSLITKLICLSPDCTV